MTFSDPPTWARTPSDPRDHLMGNLVRARGASGRVGLFGVPFDAAVIGRRGAAKGPDAIRAELALLKPYAFGRGALDPQVVDWGNVEVGEVDVAGTHGLVRETAGVILTSGQIPLALGGDHSLTFPLMEAQSTHNGKVGVINLDAHLDIREVHDGRITSGTPFGRLLEAGIVAPENLVEVGVRDFATSPYYGAKAEEKGVAVVTAAEAREGGIVDVLEDAVKRASRRTRGVYLSIDMDVLDQAHGPGVSAPTPDGLTTAELMLAVRTVAASGKVLGADVVELAPPYDEGGRTTRAAAFTVMTLLQGLK